PTAPVGAVPPAVVHRAVGAAGEAIEAIGAPADAVRLFEDDAAEALPTAPLRLRRQRGYQQDQGCQRHTDAGLDRVGKALVQESREDMQGSHCASPPKVGLFSR